MEKLYLVCPHCNNKIELVETDSLVTLSDCCEAVLLPEENETAEQYGYFLAHTDKLEGGEM